MIRAALADWALARYLARRCWRRDLVLIRRKGDGTLWAAGHPQAVGHALRGLFDRDWPRGSWHFYRVREWRGLLVASRRVFWQPLAGSQFETVHGPRLRLVETPMFVLPPWPLAVESAKLDVLDRSA